MALGKYRMVYPTSSSPRPECKSGIGSNIKVFGERTYEHLPHDGEGPITFTSESALRAHCKKRGVVIGDLL